MNINTQANNGKVLRYSFRKYKLGLASVTTDRAIIPTLTSVPEEILLMRKIFACIAKNCQVMTCSLELG